MNTFSSFWTCCRALGFIAGTTGNVALHACTSDLLPDLQTTQEMLSDPQSDLYVLKLMQAMAEFLKDQGQIKTVPDLSNILDPQFVTALNASASAG